VGVLVSNAESDRRETAYRAAGEDNYLFRLDEAHVIDATRAGNEARFINHSCAPNCRSVAEAGPDGRKHIWIEALHPIAAGAELAYDYCFDFEPDAEEAGGRIPCFCGAASCRGFMN
jgi:SET domain-containing protein